MVFAEFAKIVKQMRGTENIFGFRSTTANQLYLLYCFSGKIYYTRKIHPLVRYSWFVINLCGVLVSYTTGLACLFYDTRQDVRKLLDIFSAMGVSTDVSIVFPSVVYYYRNSIENMILAIDKLPETTLKNRHKVEKNISVEKLIPFNYCAMFGLIFVYSFACIFDVTLFYEEEKVKNFKYYPFPLPNMEENGSSRLFAAYSMLLVFASPLYWFQWITAATMITLWGAKCHNELIYVRDRINSEMEMLNEDAQKGYRSCRRWNRAFKQILIRNMRAFKMVNRTIDHFRGIVQVFCSLAIPVNFLVQVVHLYLTISMDMPFSVRLKGISFFLAAMWPMFLLYWVGEKLENGVSAVSFSVYCSPWYYSVEVRKNVHIFLCQTQKSENLFMWKVYPLVLRNYSRLIHAVLSTVNILRRVTIKFNQSRLYG